MAKPPQLAQHKREDNRTRMGWAAGVLCQYGELTRGKDIWQIDFANGHLAQINIETLAMRHKDDKGETVSQGRWKCSFSLIFEAERISKIGEKDNAKQDT